jgi:hypothetical protein
LKKSLIQQDEFIGTLRKWEPTLSESDELTGRIMQWVRDIHRTRKLNQIRPSIFKGGFPLTLPHFRPVIIGITAAILIFFFLQESDVLFRITRLEKRMAELRSYTSISIEEELRSFSRIKESSGFPGLWKLSQNESGELIIVSRHTLETILENYRIDPQFRHALRNRLNKLSPELGAVNWDDGLNQKEIQLLYNSRDRLQQLIRTL